MPNDSEEEIQGVSCSFHDVGFHVRGGQRHVYSEPAMWCLLVVVEDLVLLIVQSYLRHLFGKRCEFKYSRFFLYFFRKSSSIYWKVEYRKA